MPESAIQLVSLTKRYSAVLAVDDLSLDVPMGEVFGFLGANGSGKTTTMRTLVDLLRPTSGVARVLGFDCQREGLAARARIGYAPGEIPMYPDLTGDAYLRFVSRLGPRPVSDDTLTRLLRRFELSDRDLGRRMRDYSHGMKRKLGLVQALMTDAPVLILDEPTSGFDPLMIEAFSETIDELARGGQTTIFLSSHVLSEVDRVCGRIALIRKGRLVAVRTLAEMRAATARRVSVTFSQPVNREWLPVASAMLARREPTQWVFDVHGALGPLVTSLAGLPISDLQVETLSIEDVILRMLGD